MSDNLIIYAEKTEEEMQKLIEEAYKDDLLKRCRYDNQWGQGYQYGMIEGYKKRDAEITRCKDCKWHSDNFCDNFNVIGFGNEDYCSLGKRRENE